MTAILLAIAIATFAHADPAAEIARSPRWLRLLHYKSHWLTGTHSSVKGEGFFFSPEGRSDPEKELRATVEAFRDSTKLISKLPQPPACAFPARFRFLNEALSLHLAAPACPRWDEFLSRFHGYDSATLVFSTAYPNNPASMFGHSFLRINARGEPGKPKLDLLDSGLSYAAQVPPDENNFLFVYFGLTGGYPGAYSAVPYYAKVAEYNDSESRDLWEYDLNLSQSETWWLIANVWEIEVSSYSDYYFFDENCSYEILTLLDVARPDWNLSPYLFHNIPSETIKRVTNTPGAVKAVKFRASLFRRLSAYGDRLSEGERKSFFAVIAGGSPSLASTATLDAAAQFFHYQKQKNGELSADEAARFRAVLLARAQSAAPPAAEPSFDEATRPELGHHASRVWVGGGMERGSTGAYGGFSELGVRPAYHDLLNHDEGFVPYSEIIFPTATFRYFAPESRFYVSRVDFLEINSFSPWSWLRHSLSWRVALAYQAPEDLCTFCHVLHGEGNVGASESIAGDRVRAYELAGIFAEGGKPLSRRWRVGAKLTAGLIANVTARWKAQLEAAASSDPFALGSAQKFFVSTLLGQSYFFSPEWEARLSARAALRTREDAENRAEISAQALYYF